MLHFFFTNTSRNDSYSIYFNELHFGWFTLGVHDILKETKCYGNFRLLDSKSETTHFTTNLMNISEQYKFPMSSELEFYLPATGLYRSDACCV